MVAYDPTLPAGSSLGKSYEYGFDINTGTFADKVWQAVRRAFNINPQMTAITQDAQTYDDKGSPNADVSAWSWVLNASVYVNRNTSTGALPAELAALQARYGDARGEAAKIEVRWYHKPADGSTPDPLEAFQGVGTVAITRGNIDPTGLNERWDIVITGTGYATRISNPFEGWADADDTPAITTVLPAGQSVGEQVTISGSGLVGATGVTIDGLAAQYTVVGSSTIVATIPATAAGASPVIVTTAAGPSNTVSYTVV